MKTLWKSIAAAAGLLGGCAVYEPVGYVQTPVRVYEEPVPVYAQPAPVYVESPVSFGFNFGYWGGHGRH